MKTFGTLILAAAVAGLSSAAFAKVDIPTNPGEFNKFAKELCGTPGQNVLGLPANEFAHLRNLARKLAGEIPDEEALKVVEPTCGLPGSKEAD